MHSYHSPWQIRKTETQTRRKSRAWALLFLLLLIGMLIFPFILRPVEEEEKIVGVLVRFDENDFKPTASSTAERSSTKPAEAAEAPTEETTTEEVSEETPVTPEPQPTEPVSKVQPIPDPLPTRNTKPLLSTSSPEIDLSLRKDFTERAQVKKVSSVVTEVTDEMTDESISDIADYFKNKASQSSGSNSESTESGNNSEAGEGDQGTSEAGDSDTDGKSETPSEGTGESPGDGMDFEGDGLISRKVIRRANFDGLSQRNGKYVINLCVNKEGQVIYSEVNKDKSTIKDPSLLRLAELIARKYRYAKDYTAASRECGTLSFIIKKED